MERPAVVIQAFFNKQQSIPCEPAFIWQDEPTFLGFKLWRPNGHAVFLWAIDYVSCNDERWCVFGPMVEQDARDLVATLCAMPVCDGARIVNEHCFESLMRKPSPGKLPQWAWTDG